MKRQHKKPQVISIQQAIAHLANGGTYIPSRDAMSLMRTDPAAAQAMMNTEREANAQRARRYAKTLKKKREGNSKYVPHQGKREMYRRYFGGFHWMKKKALYSFAAA